MKSIKPGRGPSAMGAIGSVGIGVFGIFWTIGAVRMGAPTFFVFFGVIFVGLAIVQGIFHFKNAAGTNRMSLFDITEKEPDPIEDYLNKDRRQNNEIFAEMHNNDDINFCPYCGNRVVDDSFKYCPKCGNELRN